MGSVVSSATAQYANAAGQFRCESNPSKTRLQHSTPSNANLSDASSLPPANRGGEGRQMSSSFSSNAGSHAQQGPTLCDSM
eukprot:4801968-Amphidinium_carterae.1